MPIYKAKKGGYFVQINYTDAEGKYRQKKKTGFATQREAKTWEREFLSNELNFTSTAKFSKAVDMFMEDLKSRAKASSQYCYASYINCEILPYWKDYRLDQITVESVEKWQQQLIASKHKSSSLRVYQIIFKSILKYAVKKDMYFDMKVLNMPNKVKKEQKSEMLFWEIEEFNQFINVVDNLTERALFYTLYSCGLRLGEALAMQWTNVDFIRKSFTITKTYDQANNIITTPKTENSNRVVIVPDKCLNIIAELYEHDSSCVGFSEDCYLFGFDKPGFRGGGVTYAKDKYCKKAGVKRIRIHDFRHSHVSLLINLGFSPFDIAKRLGHSVDMVNNRYGHWFKDAQLKMVDKLNQTL